MQPVDPNSQYVAKAVESKDEVDDIETSMVPLRRQIERWKDKTDPASIKVTEFLRTWLSVKEKEKTKIQNSPRPKQS